MVPAEVWCAVAPPHGSGFAQCDLGFIDPGAGVLRLNGIARRAHGQTRLHERFYFGASFIVRQVRIRAAAQYASGDEISSIGRFGAVFSHVEISFCRRRMPT